MPAFRPDSPIKRRSFLKRALAGYLLAPRVTVLAEAPVALSKNHIKAVHRRRRIVMMQDAYGDGHGATPLGGDFASWLRYRFSYLDELETEIDAIWWDMAALAVYPNQGFPADVQARFDAWSTVGNDPLKALVDGTHGRGLEAFFNHRISEVELDGKTFRLKTENPDWVIPTWWPHGMWNLGRTGIAGLQAQESALSGGELRLRRPPDRFRPAHAHPAPRPAMGTAGASHRIHPPGPAHAPGDREEAGASLPAGRESAQERGRGQAGRLRPRVMGPGTSGGHLHRRHPFPGGGRGRRTWPSPGAGTSRSSPAGTIITLRTPTSGNPSSSCAACTATGGARERTAWSPGTGATRPERPA